MLIEQTGWTLDYVESLDSIVLFALTETFNAVSMARSHLRWRQAEHAGMYDSGREVVE